MVSSIRVMFGRYHEILNEKVYAAVEPVGMNAGR